MTRSNGLKTNRDAWCYNFSRSELEKNIRTTIDYYNTHNPTEIDQTKFVWTSSAVANKNRGREIEFDAAKIIESIYRQFCKQNLYYCDGLIQRRAKFPKFFPTGRKENLLICVTMADEWKFSPFITDKITDLHFNGDTQCYPLYYYEETAQGSLFGENLEPCDGISDWILNEARKRYVAGVCKEDIFYYVYGFLHLRSYREKFSAKLKKSLPRIILTDKFWELSGAGCELASIHLNYERQPAPEVQLEIRNEELGIEIFRVKKMRLSSDKTTLTYNDFITIKNIPLRAYKYVVNGRSPLEWIIERYHPRRKSI